MRIHKAPPGLQETPLPRYLRRAYPMLSEQMLKRALKQRDVRINGNRAGEGDSVRGGDELKIYIDDKYLIQEIRAVYQDERLLAVVKPAGLPVDADAQTVGEDTLLRRIQAQWPGKDFAPQLCHRLDAGTGGLVLAARDREMYERMLELFKEHKIEKVYQCLVRGCPRPEQAELRAYCLKDSRAAQVWVVDAPQPGALTMITRYRLMERKGPVSRLEVGLVTGRTHQIRAHMAHIGHPLLGDDKYGDRALNKQMHARSPYLWCVRMTLPREGIEARYQGMCFESAPEF